MSWPGILFLFIAIGALVTPKCGAAVRDWTGGSSGYWSDPNNWNPVGVPQNGERLNIHQVAHKIMTNDLINLTVNLDFEDHDFGLFGNTITLVGGSFATAISLTECADSTVNIYCGLILGGDAKVLVGAGTDFSGSTLELHLRGPVNLNGHTLTLTGFTIAGVVLGMSYSEDGLIDVAGPITGTGTVHGEIYDGSTLIFSGPDANTFSGPMILQRLTSPNAPVPTITLNKQSVPVMNDQLIILGAATVKCGQPNQIGDNATVSLTAGSRLLLQNHSDTIGSLYMTNVSSDALATFVDTGGAILSVQGNLGATNSSLSLIPTIQGFVELTSGNHTITVNSGALLYGIDLQCALMGAGGFIKNGAATLLLQGNNSFTGNLVVSSG
ncbi:MAG TPA: hypothetical protein VK530_19630, partial [Candidatus Acidoferrum sp.]|nr:hypothetical protein [Candidatus Acidoferrum sp.]